jgi:hypothetical protein
LIPELRAEFFQKKIKALGVHFWEKEGKILSRFWVDCTVKIEVLKSKLNLYLGSLSTKKPSMSKF